MVDRSAGLAILGVRDMTPGTSFTGMHVDAEECGGRPHRWFVYWSNGSGNRVVNDDGQIWAADCINQSTVHDVVGPTDRGAAV